MNGVRQADTTCTFNSAMNAPLQKPGIGATASGSVIVNEFCYGNSYQVTYPANAGIARSS